MEGKSAEPLAQHGLYHIWIVNKINGNAFSPGGFAYFAEYNSAAGDGIVLNASAVAGSNKTIAHEMGHVFELYHIFYDDAYETLCPRTDSCAYYGDRACDTEPAKVEYNCSNTTNSCTVLPYLVADVSHNYTVLNNHMNYGNCAWMFTQGQKDRARNAFFSFRHGLISSGALSAPPASSPAAACPPTASFGLSPYYGVQEVDFNNLFVYSNTSLADSSFYIDRSCNQRTTVVRGQTYPLTITGSYFNPCWIAAYIDYNDDGDFNDPGEIIISAFSNFGYTTVNVTIPATGITTNIPLRMRIICDEPTAPPTACHLTGSAVNGAGQIEDYAIIITNGSVVSATSGPWNVASTWVCNCVPAPNDEVTIKAGNTVTLTPAMGLVSCIKLTTEAGANFNNSGQIKITGP